MLVRPSSLSLNFSASKVESMFKKQFKIHSSICAIISCLTVLLFHIGNDPYWANCYVKNSCNTGLFVMPHFPKALLSKWVTWVKIDNYLLSDCCAFFAFFQGPVI